MVHLGSHSSGKGRAFQPPFEFAFFGLSRHFLADETLEEPPMPTERSLKAEGGIHARVNKDQHLQTTADSDAENRQLISQPPETSLVN